MSNGKGNGRRGPLKLRLRLPFFLLKRNIARANKWALTLIILLMAAAFINLVFINSLFAGVVASNNAQLINTTNGNINVGSATRGALIKNADATTARIRKVDGVEATSAQVSMPATIDYQGEEKNVTVVGVDPASEKAATTIPKHMVNGSYLKEGDSNGIVIGTGVVGDDEQVEKGSSFSTLKPGDKVVLATRTSSIPLTVRGIFRTKFARADGRAYISRTAMETIAPESRGAATEILVKTKHTGGEDAVVQRMKAAGVDGIFLTWEEAAVGMKEVTNSFVTINALLTTVGFIIAAVTIFIIIYVDITHKRLEIGIQRALGVKPYIIATTYVLQAGFYSLCGVAVGAALFFGVLVPYFNFHPFSIPIGDVTLSAQPADFIVRAVAVVIVGLISGVIPAIISNRHGILDSILGR